MVAKAGMGEEKGVKEVREENCHICNISSGTSRRKFAQCTKCPCIVCKPCVENTGAYWSSVSRQRSWACQKCLGSCPCKKCYNGASTIVYSDLRKRTRREQEKTTSSDGENANDSSSVEGSGDEEIERSKNSSEVPRETEDSPPPPKKQKRKHQEDVKKEGGAENEKSKNISDDGLDMDYVRELVEKNQQCLQYLTRTERLLEMIQKEQKNIERDLAKLAKTHPHSQLESVLNSNPQQTPATSS